MAETLLDRVKELLDVVATLLDVDEVSKLRAGVGKAIQQCCIVAGGEAHAVDRARLVLLSLELLAETLQLRQRAILASLIRALAISQKNDGITRVRHALIQDVRQVLEARNEVSATSTECFLRIGQIICLVG